MPFFIRVKRDGMARRKGKLIVIDGSDGSGKATQTRLLVRALRKRGVRVRTLDFPQYEKNFFGSFVGRCITGDHGDFVALDPHITSVIYAADRWESSARITRWLAAGDTVVLDRYVSANQIHQGGKIASARKRTAFLAWLDTMEYEVLHVPRPDAVVYLDVPVAVTMELLARAQQDKPYLRAGKCDTVECDPAYLRNARTSALWLARTQPRWYRIRCVRGGTLRTIDDIHAEVLQTVARII